MARYRCRNDHTWSGRSSLSPSFSPAELTCRECGAVAEPKLKRRSMRKVAMTCPDCGVEFERRAARPGTGKCISCAKRHRPIRVVECAGCGSTFETREPDQSHCGRRCYLENHPGPTQEQLDAAASIGRARTGARNPNFRHGRRTSEHERRLAREFNLAKKGEHVCRVCASTRSMNAHHAVPRGLSRAGKYDLRNCLPLCATCHTSWHRRSLTIYRDAFTEAEWEFMATLINSGWLDERYPDRGRPFREEGLERVAA